MDSSYIEVENIWHFDYDDASLIGKKFTILTYDFEFIKKIEELLFKVDQESNVINPKFGRPHNRG